MAAPDEAKNIHTDHVIRWAQFCEDDTTILLLGLDEAAALEA
jgi:hypothetical protein